MRIVVVGGTGLVGEKLVNILRHRGHDVVVASRKTGVNTLTGEGLSNAIDGSRVVIDVTNSPTLDGKSVMEFFGTSSRNLLATEEAARVKHHVVLSVVGTDRLLNSAYFRAKMMQEDLVRHSPIPHTILRSTQFFDFLRRIPEPHLNGTAVRVSPAFVQPIAADEVAAALADLALASPRNDMIEHAGPELFHLDDIVRHVMAASGDPRAVIADSRARYFGAELSNDSLTPDEGAIIGVTRFDAWLEQHASTLRAEDLTLASSLLHGATRKRDFHTQFPRPRGARKILSLNR
ncbi:SDR family oxidoreductase [Povalibacter sp.]|uniref:SDR family oxidoreductase n=1 Tax=Povalibacter sp. TaxID=1962978 RepID=UPI002F41C42D